MSSASFIVLPIILVIAISSSVNSQPLDQPAESFLCGPLNVTCDRWGYTACVNPDGEFYCITCNHEYVSNLCGKKDQVPGCNLYCIQKILDMKREKLHHLFSKESEDMQNGFTEILREAKYHSQNQTQQYQKDIDLNLSKIKSLEDAITVEKNSTKLYRLLSICLTSLIFLSIGCLVFWFLRRKKRNQTVIHLESAEKQILMKCNQENYYRKKGFKISKENEPVLKESSTQTEENIDVYEHKNELMDVNESGQCAGSNCPGKDLLQNVSPTNDRDGSDKMAVHGYDMDFPVGE